MVQLSQDVVAVALPLSLILASMLGLLLALVIVRRMRRRLHFRRLDEAWEVSRPVLEELLTGSRESEEGLGILRAAAKRLEPSFLERLLTADRNPPPERAAILRKLSEDLGLVSLWQARLGGRRSPSGPRPGRGLRLGRLHPVRSLGFVGRAQAAENLGIIRHQPSWRLLVEALDDPHLDVRSVAARALARIKEGESFPALAQRLASAALDPAPKLSVRTLKTALTGFALPQTACFQDSLLHPHPRVRFLAADVVSAIVEREAAEGTGSALEPARFPHPLAEIFLTRLAKDHNPDVRARAADVIGRLDDPRALPALLSLLEDAEWFARLHAVRALGNRKLAPLGALSQRLTDPHWRVREAAARALCARGRPGTDRLVNHFLNTQDRYSQEQVAEEIDRAGLTLWFLETATEPGRESELRFLQGLVRLGKGSMLLATFPDGLPSRKCKTLLRALARDPDPRMQSFVRQLAGAPAEVPDPKEVASG